jgi:hypothetical protein
MACARTARRDGVLTVDPGPLLASSDNAAIAYFARRDLLGGTVDLVSVLWDLPEARRVLGKQSPDGSWRHPGGKRAIRSQENYAPA